MPRVMMNWLAWQMNELHMESILCKSRLSSVSRQCEALSRPYCEREMYVGEMRTVEGTLLTKCKDSV